MNLFIHLISFKWHRILSKIILEPSKKKNFGLKLLLKIYAWDFLWEDFFSLSRLTLYCKL